MITGNLSKTKKRITTQAKKKKKKMKTQEKMESNVVSDTSK